MLPVSSHMMMVQAFTSCSASAVLFLSHETCCAGVTVIGEVNAWTSNVMNLIWLIGTFTFAVVLAVVTEDIVATVLVSQRRHVLYRVLFYEAHNTHIKACTTHAVQPLLFCPLLHSKFLVAQDDTV